MTRVPIKTYRKDPRTTEEKAADKEILHRIDAGDRFGVDPAVERAAIEVIEGTHRVSRQTTMRAIAARRARG